tara:strand:+ start:347 stop:1213 length:867 start_codon:yes stop_codon:yes gene_type:complete
MLFAGLLITSLTAFEQRDFLSGDEIMKKVRERGMVDSEIGLLRSSLIKKDGHVEEREMISIFKKRPDNSGYDYLVRFVEPQSMYGTTLLTSEAKDGAIDQKLYIPKQKSFKEVKGDKAADYFKSTPFEFEDVVRENPKRFQYSRMLNENINSIPCYQIMADPVAKEDKERLHYERRILYISRSTFDIVKVQYFDDKGNITRVFEGYDFSEEDTALRPDRGVMYDQSDKITSIVTVIYRKKDASLPSDLFTENYIKNWGPKQDEALLGNTIEVLNSKVDAQDPNNKDNL